MCIDYIQVRDVYRLYKSYIHFTLHVSLSVYGFVCCSICMDNPFTYVYSLCLNVRNIYICAYMEKRRRMGISKYTIERERPECKHISTCIDISVNTHLYMFIYMEKGDVLI